MEITACTVLLSRTSVSLRYVAAGRVLVRHIGQDGRDRLIDCEGLDKQGAAYKAACKVITSVTGQAGHSNIEINDLRHLLCQVGGC